MLAAASVAVVVAFVMLRSITDPEPGPAAVVGEAVSTTVPAATTGPATTTTSTTSTTTSTTSTTLAPVASKSDATVVVANASGVDRSATAMSDDLEADGYTTAPVANATGPRLERSIVYYLPDDPAALGVARLLAEQIPTARTLPMPERPPLDRPLGDARVALLLGTDAAGRPLDELRDG